MSSSRRAIASASWSGDSVSGVGSGRSSVRGSLPRRRRQPAPAPGSCRRARAASAPTPSPCGRPADRRGARTCRGGRGTGRCRRRPRRRAARGRGGAGRCTSGGGSRVAGPACRAARHRLRRGRRRPACGFPPRSRKACPSATARTALDVGAAAGSVREEGSDRERRVLDRVVDVLVRIATPVGEQQQVAGSAGAGRPREGQRSRSRRRSARAPRCPRCGTPPRAGRRAPTAGCRVPAW